MQELLKKIPQKLKVAAAASLMQPVEEQACRWMVEIAGTSKVTGDCPQPFHNIVECGTEEDILDRTMFMANEAMEGILAAPVHAGLDEQVRALKRRAQIALGVGMGACWTHLDVFWIDVLRPGKPDCGMVIHDRVQVCSANTALAAVLGDGSVVPWRDAGNGGDSRAVQDRLKTVLRIEASADAFAAMLGDGSVMRGQGPDGDYQETHDSDGAFVGLVAHGSVVPFGDIPLLSIAVQTQLPKSRRMNATSPHSIPP
ncbi:hypothetical protein AK812_SmicGene15704 [Symbiodinium microadriaticum]|uniref:Uncharacterized protein n=1 Tax=Symbiodinium microadriaticum TaxID=2951 RepID=A0A1Q9E2C8_SYMMI|nr:hypothetical protein AK812_SmicGene15704 [Symbiodinium microadriaticum]